MKSYHSKPLGAAPPHVYAIADTAYRALNTENTDQARWLWSQRVRGAVNCIFSHQNKQPEYVKSLCIFNISRASTRRTPIRHVGHRDE